MSEASYPQPSRLRPEPLWYQVEQAIQAIVKSGEWATGAQIPAEERLCALFGVSRITLRHALRNLEEHGLLRREHGRGTFVRSAWRKVMRLTPNIAQRRSSAGICAPVAHSPLLTMAWIACST